jgi:hypothetical protein
MAITERTKMGTDSAARYGIRMAVGTAATNPTRRADRPGAARSATSTSGTSSPASRASARGRRKTPNETPSRRSPRRSGVFSR